MKPDSCNEFDINGKVGPFQKALTFSCLLAAPSAPLVSTSSRQPRHPLPDTMLPHALTTATALGYIHVCIAWSVNKEASWPPCSQGSNVPPQCRGSCPIQCAEVTWIVCPGIPTVLVVVWGCLHSAAFTGRCHLGKTKSTVKVGSWSTVKPSSTRSDNRTLFCRKAQESSL